VLKNIIYEESLPELMRRTAIFVMLGTLYAGSTIADIKEKPDQWNYAGIPNPERVAAVADAITSDSCPAYSVTNEGSITVGVPNDPSLPTVRVRDAKPLDSLELELAGEKVLDEGLEGRANRLEKDGKLLFDTTTGASEERQYQDALNFRLLGRVKEALYRLTNKAYEACFPD